MIPTSEPSHSGAGPSSSSAAAAPAGASFLAPAQNVPRRNSLVRGNSVVTLNQIYQHHNSIPVRNRILNTAKSLQQQPSIELGLPHPIESEPAALQPHQTAPVAMYQQQPTPLTSSQQRHPAIYHQQRSSDSLGAPTLQVHHHPTTATTMPIGQQQAAPRSSPMLAPNLQVVHPSAQQSITTAVKIINVARRYKRPSSDFYESHPPPWASTPQVRNPMRVPASPADWSASDSESEPDRSLSAGQRVVSNISPKSVRSQLQHPESSATNVVRSKSPSPVRSPAQVNQSQQQRSRVLPKLASVEMGYSMQGANRQLAAPVASHPGSCSSAEDLTNPARLQRQCSQQTTQATTKVHRKLPQIPGQQISPIHVQQQQQQQLIRSSATNKSLSGPSSCSSRLTATSAGSTYDSSCNAGKAPTTNSHSLRQQASLRVQSFPMPSSSAPTSSSSSFDQSQPQHQPAQNCMLFPGVAPVAGSGAGQTQSQPALLVSRRLQRVLRAPAGSFHSNSASSTSNSTDTPSPRSPIGALVPSVAGANVAAARHHQQQQQQQPQPLGCLIGSSSSMSGGSNSASFGRIAPAPAPATPSPSPSPGSGNPSKAYQQQHQQQHQQPQQQLKQQQQAAGGKYFTFDPQTTGNCATLSSRTNEPQLMDGGGGGVERNFGQPTTSSSNSNNKTSDWISAQDSAAVAAASSCLEQLATSTAANRQNQGPQCAEHTQTAGQLQAPAQQTARGRRLSSCGSGLRANFLMNKQHAISEFTPPRSLESSASRGSCEYQMGQNDLADSAKTEQPKSVAQRHFAAATSAIKSLGRAAASSLAGLPPRAASATETNSTGTQESSPFLGLLKQQPLAHSVQAMQQNQHHQQQQLHQQTGPIGHLTSTAASEMPYNEIELQLAPPARVCGGGSLALPSRDRQPSNVSTASMPAPLNNNNSNYGSSLTAASGTGNNDAPSTGTRKFGAWAERIALSANSGKQLQLGQQTSSDFSRRVRSASPLSAAAGRHSVRLSSAVSSSSMCSSSSAASSSAAVASSSSSSSSSFNSASSSDYSTSTSSEGEGASPLTSRSQCSRRASIPSDSCCVSSGGESSLGDLHPKKAAANLQQPVRTTIQVGLRHKQSKSKSTSSTSARAGQRSRKCSTSKKKERRSKKRHKHNKERLRRASKTQNESVGKQLEDDNLTLADRLRLAEVSANRLFRKVELAQLHHNQAACAPDYSKSNRVDSGGATSCHNRHADQSLGPFELEPNNRAPPTKTGDREAKLALILSAAREANQATAAAKKPATTSATKNDDGDDLSLFLRLLDKQRHTSALVVDGQNDKSNNATCVPPPTTTTTGKSKSSQSRLSGFASRLGGSQKQHQPRHPQQSPNQHQKQHSVIGRSSFSRSADNPVVRDSSTAASAATAGATSLVPNPNWNPNSKTNNSKSGKSFDENMAVTVDIDKSPQIHFDSLQRHSSHSRCPTGPNNIAGFSGTPIRASQMVEPAEPSSGPNVAPLAPPPPPTSKLSAAKAIGRVIAIRSLVKSLSRRRSNSQSSFDGDPLQNEDQYDARHLVSVARGSKHSGATSIDAQQQPPTGLVEAPADQAQSNVKRRAARFLKRTKRSVTASFKGRRQMSAI